MTAHFVGRISGIRQDGLDSGSRFVGFSADEALVGVWTRLELTAHLPTQFYAFAASLSDTLLADAPLTLLIASTANGASALLPLCRGKGYFARWRAIGPQELSEPVDALCADEEGAALLARALSRQSRPLRLDRIPASSGLIPALQSAMKGRGWLSVRPAVPTPTITLDESWKAPETQFNSGRRSDFRRAARRAGEHGPVTYEVLSPGADEFDALFDEAIGVEVRSWKKEAGTAIAVDRAKESFFRDFFRSASRQGIFRVAFLRIDGQAVAMQMGLECLNRYWLFKIGYDEAFGKCSPGTLLMLHTLGWAAERRLHSYELLGDVEPWIAALWTREHRECLRVRTYPFGIQGAVGFAADFAVWALARLKPKAAAA